jgi:hypothetical protein
MTVLVGSSPGLMTRRIYALVCTLAFVVGLSGCLRANESRLNEQAQKELLTFLGGLESGMSPSSVEALFNRGHYRQLTLRRWQKDRPPQLVISTPIIWGAGNWIAYVDFERDVIFAVRVRTADSINDHPDAAPADRTFQP